MRLTKHRREILEHLRSCEGVFSATDIHLALPHINLVTVYRALDYLTKQSSLKKIYLSGDEAYFEFQHEPHHHALCTDCGKVIHFTTDNKELAREFSVPGFIINDLEVTIRGRCRSHSSTLHQK